MIFNSPEFLLFLPIVFLCYWFLFKKNLRTQNFFLFAASYFFYGWWDWRFVFLLMTSTLIDFYFGKIIYKKEGKSRKIFLWLSVFNNLIILFFFKYYNFFALTVKTGLAQLGFHADPVFLNLILPVGISFYTFHGMSYVFDIYNRKTKPENNFIDYALFVSFFPLLVAGPIERATHLLPQIVRKRNFKYSQCVDGLRLILWGFFKKVVIADTLAETVDQIFKGYTGFSGSTLLLGAIYFAIQIYGDFSGYSDIAIGVAKLFGFELLSNFKFPYFSRDIAEFWRRWHISLSSWFKDYLYIPLGGSKNGKWKAVRNTFIIFLVSGFWHGANFTYIIWGAVHAILFLPLLLTNRNRKNSGEVVAQNSSLPTFSEFISITITFCSVVFAWIFFRAPNLQTAIQYIRGIGHQLLVKPEFLGIMPYVFAILFIDWFNRKNERAVLGFIKNRQIRYILYVVMGLIILAHFKFTDQTQFIYFQF